MKSALAMMAVACVGTVPALAQAPAFHPPGPPAHRPIVTPPPSSAAPAARPGPTDSRVFRTGTVLPAPLAPDEVPAATLVLPTEPIEPYLLTKDAGPFMVNAYVFRGPDATRYAQALAIELRRDHRLPAYVFHLKFQPGGSNIRGVPPTAPGYVRQPYLAAPEQDRTYDEAAVLVGNSRSIDESEKVLHQVKKIHPKCLDQVPSILPWRKGQGLSRATLTTNPLAAAQNLYPGRSERPHVGQTVDPFVLTSRFESPADGSIVQVNGTTIERPAGVRRVDAFVKKLNAGPRSIFHCPGPYTLQVAEFSGRTAIAGRGPLLQDERTLRQSPLLTAHEDAEELAASLARLEVLRRLGCQPYVFHDRTASWVTVGSFQAPNDPRAEPIRTAMLNLTVEVKEHTGGIFDVGKKMTQISLAPAAKLMPVPRP